MAVTGILLVLFLVAHMVGNLKVFFGETSFDNYAHWLRGIGSPLLPETWYLWLQRGVLTLKNPGKISFDYEGGQIRIVSNGRSLVFADYEVRQLERWPIGNSPLGALLDPNRDVKRYGKLLPTSNPNVISVEVKDASKPEYGTIAMVFVRNPSAPGGLELSSWVALDAQNKRTTVRLSNHRYGLSVPDSKFSYRDPRSTSRRR